MRIAERQVSKRPISSMAWCMLSDRYVEGADTCDALLTWLQRQRFALPTNRYLILTVRTRVRRN